jgi:hypothetical protein
MSGFGSVLEAWSLGATSFVSVLKASAGQLGWAGTGGRVLRVLNFCLAKVLAHRAPIDVQQPADLGAGMAGFVQGNDRVDLSHRNSIRHRASPSIGGCSKLDDESSSPDDWGFSRAHYLLV